MGYWCLGVGKTTFGKSLLEGLTDIPTVYLDGDSDEGYELIPEVVENGPAVGQIVLIAAPYIEKRSFRKITQPPLIINLIADETTRHNNLYNRAGGHRSLSLSVERIIRYRRESQNYIIPNPDAVIVDSSLQCRISPELISQQVKDLLAIEGKKQKQP